MIFPGRGSGGPGRFLQERVRVLLFGAILALAGIGLDSSILVGLAILVLIGGVVLSFLSGQKQGKKDDASGRGESHEDSGPELH